MKFIFTFLYLCAFNFGLQILLGKTFFCIPFVVSVVLLLVIHAVRKQQKEKNNTENASDNETAAITKDISVNKNKTKKKAVIIVCLISCLIILSFVIDFCFFVKPDSEITCYVYHKLLDTHYHNTDCPHFYESTAKKTTLSRAKSLSYTKCPDCGGPESGLSTGNFIISFLISLSIVSFIVFIAASIFSLYPRCKQKKECNNKIKLFNNFYKPFIDLYFSNSFAENNFVEFYNFVRDNIAYFENDNVNIAGEFLSAGVQYNILITQKKSDEAALFASEHYYPPLNKLCAHLIEASLLLAKELNLTAYVILLQSQTRI